MGNFNPGSGELTVASYDKQGILRPTVTEGEIIVRSNPDAETDGSLDGLNRDIERAREITRDEEVYVNVYVSPSAIQEIMSGGEGIRKGINSYAEHLGDVFAKKEIVVSTVNDLKDELEQTTDPARRQWLEAEIDKIEQAGREGASVEQIAEMGAKAISDDPAEQQKYKEEKKQEEQVKQEQKKQEVQQNLDSAHTKMSENKVDPAAASTIVAQLAKAESLDLAIEQHGGIDSLSEAQKQSMRGEMEKAAAAAILAMEGIFGDPGNINSATVNILGQNVSTERISGLAEASFDKLYDIYQAYKGYQDLEAGRINTPEAQAWMEKSENIIGGAEFIAQNPLKASQLVIEQIANDFQTITGDDERAAGETAADYQPGGLFTKGTKILGALALAGKGGGVLKHLPVPKSLPKHIHVGSQNKHIPGTNNFIKTRDPLLQSINPQELLDGVFDGKYKIIRQTGTNKVTVDFGQIIGANRGNPTQYGTVHWGKNGAHIVPAKPDQW